jgi:drug/metabolite transporter (DMT)-like permease
MSSSPEPILALARDPPAARRASLTLLLGLLAVSTSGPFFVMSKLSAFAAVFWRALLAGALALGFAALRRRLDLRALRACAPALIAGGVLLAGHFLLWVKAFELTDYASNLLLLVAQPIFAALLDAWTGQPMSRTTGLTLSLAAVGLLMVAGSDISLGPRALLGDTLSLLGGALIALFYVVSRAARRALTLDAFLGATMLIVALVALPVAWVAGVALSGYSAASWAWLLGLVCITTLGGHGLLNLAARSLPLYVVNLGIVLEPVLAFVLGALLFAAEISWLQCLGGVLLSSAVVLELRNAAVSAPDTLPTD